MLCMLPFQIWLGTEVQIDEFWTASSCRHSVAWSVEGTDMKSTINVKIDHGPVFHSLFIITEFEDKEMQ